MSYQLQKILVGVEDNEATVLYGRFDEGAHVDQDEDIVELRDAKATFTLLGPVGSSIVEMFEEEGGMIEVGAVMAVIEPD